MEELENLLSNVKEEIERRNDREVLELYNLYRDIEIDLELRKNIRQVKKNEMDNMKINELRKKINPKGEITNTGGYPKKDIIKYLNDVEEIKEIKKQESIIETLEEIYK